MKRYVTYLRYRHWEYWLFWTGHNPSHQESMDHLPLAAGPGHLQTLPTMSSLGLPRIPRKTSTSNLKLQPSKSQNLIQAKKQLNSSESQLNKPNSPNSWIHILGVCISPLPVYEPCKRRLLWIHRVQNTNDFLGMPYANLSLVSSIESTLPIPSRWYRNCSLRISFVGGVCSRGALWRLRLPVCPSHRFLLRLWLLSTRSCHKLESCY